MSVKKIVKVMNFHAMLRVDLARKQAEKYSLLEAELTRIIDQIVNNRNFILDKNIQSPEKNMPELNLFFGSDFGFCGSINSQINQLIGSREDREAVLIGKKMHEGGNVVLHLNREDFTGRYGLIKEKLQAAVNELKYSKINLIYNHYYNISRVEPVIKCIYPMQLNERREELYKEDYAVEGEINELLRNLIIAYLGYEVRIAAINSFASENVARQSSTNESLKKIEEQEEERAKIVRKIRNRKVFEKMIDNYIKKKGIGGKR